MPANAHTSKKFTRLCNNASKKFNSMCKHIQVNKYIASTMPANANTSKKFTRLCSAVALQLRAPPK